MTKTIYFILFFYLIFFKLSAQINLNGTIYFNNEPQSNVTIYLNNTTIGTITNNNGAFNLEIKDGVYQLIISHIGFKTIKYNFDTSTYTKPLVFSLSEEEFVLDEVIIKGEKNNFKWEYNFSVFFRAFIGASEFSKFCTVQNPEVLFFEFDSENSIFTAEAIEPLHIKNEALGYDIFYDLKHFSIENQITNYLGYSYFKALKGDKKKWIKNRLKAYNGSQVHFYKSLLKNSSKEEGFVINEFVRKKNKDRPSEEEILKARKAVSKSNATLNLSRKIDIPENAIDSALIILKKAKLPKYIDYLDKAEIASSDIIYKENNTTYLQFDNNLRITYLRENEEKGYILRNPSSKPRKAFPQTSNIIPLTEKFIVYPQGILANPLDVLYEEYWSYEKFAHSLPLDYEPNSEN
ncbi:carboxypeptidase-like regulatory domain-containing protein [Mariniflexile gromovii]|uniref:Carboxypeptidase-like regulatory domain-containing protein n=1 Tax=Mariniflexile gromovii TaxID=362523 RepID=A0ABS4BTE5_9FLAO|nr:carboxypeptidase-like regulatory domain-containing protein [Mariniflexile gromovii]MBP0903855.1 carboxypeptidase-like regulatory domain-containing protein [Mariniflexile gromovii]